MKLKLLTRELEMKGRNDAAVIRQSALQQKETLSKLREELEGFVR